MTGQRLYITHAEYAATVATGNLRRFTRIGGFCDSTEYIAIDENDQEWVVMRTGFVMRGFVGYLARCLQFVADGSWVELEGDA
jgi:hypothetical protein